MSVLFTQSAGALLRRAAQMAAVRPRNELAAVRVERTKGAESAQSAVTMWFGEGPSLPAPGTGRREALRIGAGIAAAASLAAMAALAAQTDQNRARIRSARARVIDPPTTSS